MKSKQVMPTTYLLAAMLLMVILHLVLPLVRIVPPLWNLIGILPIAIGVAINLLADRAFHRAATTVKPYQESSALITDGVFGLTRNPMYVGFVLILLGVAVLLRSLSPYVVVLAFALLMDRMYIVVEERMLVERFGQEWEAYRGRVRRWI
jgi:protein-S-isoprenylcysteine O-methyltransferase Ste14